MILRYKWNLLLNQWKCAKFELLFYRSLKWIARFHFSAVAAQVRNHFFDTDKKMESLLYKMTSEDEVENLH
jgi:hypothetical protein